MHSLNASWWSFPDRANDYGSDDCDVGVSLILLITSMNIPDRKDLP
jgi:hypothetical protein